LTSTQRGKGGEASFWLSLSVVRAGRNVKRARALSVWLALAGCVVRAAAAVVVVHFAKLRRTLAKKNVASPCMVKRVAIIRG